MLTLWNGVDIQQLYLLTLPTEGKLNPMVSKGNYMLL